MLPLLIVLLVSPMSLLAYENLIVNDENFADFGELEEFSSDLINLGMEDFTSIKGIRHKACKINREKCKEFIKCTTNCDSFLIDFSSLSDATFSGKEDKTIIGKTNPCVAMYAYCIPARPTVLQTALDLISPKDY